MPIGLSQVTSYTERTTFRTKGFLNDRLFERFGKKTRRGTWKKWNHNSSFPVPCAVLDEKNQHNVKPGTRYKYQATSLREKLLADSYAFQHYT